MGGTTGYLVSKKGANKFLDFLNETGATNGIDTCIQKSADTLNIYYSTPHLIYSDCVRGQNNPDSNIQYDYTGFEKSIFERINDEIQYFQNQNKILLKIQEYENVCKYVINKDAKNPAMYVDDDATKIENIKQTSVFPVYLIGKKTIFIIPDEQDIVRYYHRYKKNNKFDISDSLSYE